MVASPLACCLSLLGAVQPRGPVPRASAFMRAGAAPVCTPENLRDMVDRALEGAAKKRVALLGSTGSIGTQTLDICREYPDSFEVVSLSAGSNVALLAQQIAEFRPSVVGLAAAEKEEELRALLAAAGAAVPEIVVGPEGQTAAATAPGADTVVTGVVGCAGLLPTIEAIKLGRTIALANKETLIAGGPIILPLLEKHGAKMTAADSEHSAIFQCLQGVPPDALRRVILTASGGAFRDVTADELKLLNDQEPETVRAKATTHPNWDMGAKITVDSATMMNKGLEVRGGRLLRGNGLGGCSERRVLRRPTCQRGTKPGVHAYPAAWGFTRGARRRAGGRAQVIEAHYLFGAGYDNIDIVVHPQSIIHSAIETSDSSVIAQLGWPDMRLPILYAMSWPHRVPVDYGRGIDRKFDLVELSSMTFKAPDYAKYPCIPLAYAAGRKGGTMTCALNAANERANELFRAGAFDFFGIPRVIESTMEAHKEEWKAEPTLEDIIAVDTWARAQVDRVAAKDAPVVA